MKPKHKNLFAHGEGSAEVYTALQHDYAQGAWVQSLWLYVLGGVAIVGAYFAGHGDWFWIFVGIFAAERSICCFIDMSNRNWTMHMIDWIEDRDRVNDKRL